MPRWNPFKRNTSEDTHGRHYAPGESKSDRLTRRAAKRGVQAENIGGEHRRGESDPRVRRSMRAGAIRDFSDGARQGRRHALRNRQDRRGG